MADDARGLHAPLTTLSPGRVKPAIISLSNTDWRGSRMSRQHVLTNLAQRGWPVIYGTGALTMSDRGTRGWDEARWLASTEREDGVVLAHGARLTPCIRRSPRLNRMAQHRYARHLSRTARAAREGPYYAYVWHPMYACYLDLLGHERLIYHAVDIHAQMPGVASDNGRAEQELVARADLVIASSPAIARNLPGDRPSRARVLYNGGDFARYRDGASLPCPADLAAIPSPRIAHTGHVNPKLDYGLVARLAPQRPDWQWLFIGPVNQRAIGRDPEAGPALAACQALPNVHFLGGKHYDELPAYCGNVDVNMMCYRATQSGWWYAVSPLKLFDYLAVGRPVVSAALESVEPFTDVIDVATTDEEWLAALGRAIDGNGKASTEKRQEVASANSWELRTETIEKWLLSL